MSEKTIEITDDIKKMPELLYRGDQSKRVCVMTGRSLMVDQYQRQGLFTNLICSGNPLAVARSGIRQTVCTHINGWPQSHYLSFSEDRRIAELFAKGVTSKNLVSATGQTWDSAVFSFDTSQFTWSIHGIGVYFGQKSHWGPPYLNGVTQLALIDCVKILTSLVAAGQNQYQNELQCARWDKEWLLIPLDPLDPTAPNSHIGYSAQLLPGLVTGDHYDLV